MFIVDRSAQNAESAEAVLTFWHETAVTMKLYLWMLTCVGSYWFRCFEISDIIVNYISLKILILLNRNFFILVKGLDHAVLICLSPS